MKLWPLIIALPEALRNAGDPDGPRAIARERGVNYLIHWSIRGIVDRLAVNLRLGTVESRNQLWSEEFYINRRIEVLPRQDWTSDDLVVRGLALFYRPVTAQIDPNPHRQEALNCFEQALAMAPDSIHDKIGVACVLVTGIAVGDPAHLLMGILRRGQFRLDESLTELKVTIGLAPNHSHHSPILDLT